MQAAEQKRASARAEVNQFGQAWHFRRGIRNVPLVGFGPFRPLTRYRYRDRRRSQPTSAPMSTMMASSTMAGMITVKIIVVIVIAAASDDV